MSGKVFANVTPASLAMALSPAEIMRRAGLEPEGWQRDILNARPRRLGLNVCRGGGKTTTACAMSVDELLNGRALHGLDPLVICVAPAERQSRRLLRQVRAMLKRLPNAPIPVRSTQTEMEFDDGGLMVALPSTEGIRGYQSCTALLWEEMSRFAEDADGATPAVDATTPMLAETGRIVALSTPAGQRGEFWKIMTRPDLYRGWRRVTVTGEQSERISKRKLDEERRRMLPNIFAAEYGCDFNDSGSQIFRTDMIRAALTGDVEPIAVPWPRFAKAS